MIRTFLRTPALLASLGLGAWAVVGCADKSVIADVGKTQVHQADLAAFAARKSRASADDSLLDSLVSRELLAEGGRRAGLEAEPEVAARLAASRRELLAEAFLEQELKPLTTEKALRDRYAAEEAKLVRRRVHVQQISLLFPAHPTAQQRAAIQARASQAYARALHGDDFGALSRELSDDPVGREKGGDLGWLEEGQVAPAFFEAAFKLQRGQVGAPVESPFGLHVVRALEDPQQVSPSFAEVRSKLLAEARSEGEAQILVELRSNTEVRLHPENQVAAVGGHPP